MAPPRTARRLTPFTSTIFADMTELANRTGAINLGQGFPDTDGPALVREVAQAAIASGPNQYLPSRGLLQLRAAIATQRAACFDQHFDPETEITVTFGATEAIAASLLGLLEPGDEVLVFDPAYDAYLAAIALAGGVAVRVPLLPWSWRLDLEAFDAAITNRTVAVIVNEPHNPTGSQLHLDDALALASRLVEHDLWCLADEVYEQLVFDRPHRPLATYPGLAERTLTISSGGKTFSMTGWKVGWAMGPAEMVAATASAKNFLSFTGGGPFQLGIAAGLVDPVARVAALPPLRAARDQFVDGLRQLDFEVSRPSATYFAISDLGSIGASEASLVSWELPSAAGVGAIAVSAFCGTTTLTRHPAYATMLRWAFCKVDVP